MKHKRSFARWLQRSTLVAATVAGGWGAAFGAAAAPMDGHGPGPGGHRMMGMMPLSERALDAINASADQRAQLKQIFEAARADLKAQRDSGRALLEQMRTLFTQPTVDARAAETLRQQRLALQDQTSKRMLQAMLDASRVLSPEQRARLAELMAQRRGPR